MPPVIREAIAMEHPNPDFYPIKNAYGFIPFSGVCTDGTDQQWPLQTTKTWIAFGKPDSDVGFKKFHGPENLSLSDLATCVQLRDQQNSNAQSLFNLAETTGPLFGQGYSEYLGDWAYAANTALVAINVQNLINQNNEEQSLVSMGWSGRLKNYSILNSNGYSAGTILQAEIYSRQDGMYSRMLPLVPIKRMEYLDQPRSYLYGFSFRHGTDIANQVKLDITQVCVIQTLKEPSVTDISAAIGKLAALNAFHEIKDCELAKLLLELELPKASAADITRMNLVATDLSQSHAAAAHHLNKLLVDMHLKNTRVDMFTGAEDCGYIEFDSALSYLWFRFAQTLRQTEIKFCPECGRAFSTIGHRGIPRKYCSDACRTAAKNKRTRKGLSNIRKDFSQGKSVAEIAEGLHGGSHADVIHVIESLESWKKLRDDVANSIEDDGWEESALLKRCIDEGLDPERFLRGKQLMEYKKRCGFR